MSSLATQEMDSFPAEEQDQPRHSRVAMIPACADPKSAKSLVHAHILAAMLTINSDAMFKKLNTINSAAALREEWIVMGYAKWHYEAVYRQYTTAWQPEDSLTIHLALNANGRLYILSGDDRNSTKRFSFNASLLKFVNSRRHISCYFHNRLLLEFEFKTTEEVTAWMEALSQQ